MEKKNSKYLLVMTLPACQMLLLRAVNSYSSKNIRLGTLGILLAALIPAKMMLCQPSTIVSLLLPVVWSIERSCRCQGKA
jgi:hypothetical protein